MNLLSSLVNRDAFPAWRGGGGGGVVGGLIRISSDWDERMGAKMKTQQNPYGLKQNPKNSLDQNLTPKKSHTEFPSHKNFQRNYAAQIRGNYNESSDCFESPKKSLLKSSYPKNNLPKFSYPKKSRNRNFQTPKILRSSLSLQIRSTLPLRTRSWLN